MYEEREKFSIKDVVLQVILVALFVFLLLWLFPTKSYVDNQIDSKLQPFYNQIFTTNINNMKEAAVSYFTTSRLPKNIGDKEKLTLSEMLDKKLLISFLDSNNKKCDLTSSYVEITKMDDEYVLKVNLSCSDNSDYILVHLGCYNYCENGLCEKQESTTINQSTQNKVSVTPLVTKNYEYEYEKVIDGKWGEWSEWSEWSNVKVDKTDYRNVKTKQELVVTGEETIKVGTKTIITDAVAKKTYYCPTGYTKDGTTCIKAYTTKDVIAATAKTNTTYSCEAYPGYTLNGTNCVKTITSSSIDTKKATAKTNTTYSCEAYSGYTLSGTNCVKTITSSSVDKKSAKENKTYGSWEYVSTKEYSSKKVSSNTVKYDFVSSRTALDCDNSCKTITYYTYKKYERNVKTTYSCEAYPGYTLNGTNCVKTITSSSVDTKKATAKTNTTYSCEAYPGYTLSGTNCVKTITSSSVDTKKATAKTNTTYSCEAYPGYTLNGTNCDKQITKTQVIKASTKTDYSCKVGDLVERGCVTYEDKYETFNKYTTVIYYSYQEREYISGERKVTWSKSQNDQTLIKDGYSLTGKSREI